jgi:hypothetical protein
MQRVGWALLARAKCWEPSQDIRDRPVFSGSVRRWNELNWSQPGCDYNQTATVLRDSVILAVNDLLLRVLHVVEPLVVKRGHEVGEDFIALKFRDVLHAHDIGLGLAYESGKVSEQGPFWIPFILKALRVLGKRLAGRASNQYACVALWVVGTQVAIGKKCYALLVELCPRVVVFIWKSTLGVGVIASRNFHASVQEAAR